MREKDDKELVILARQENELAKEELYRRCKDVITYHVQKYKGLSYAKLYRQDVQDMVSECHIAVMEAIDLYDPNRGSGFSNFAKFVIRTRLNRHLSARAEQIKDVIDGIKLDMVSAPESRLKDLTITVKNERERKVVKFLLDEGMNRAEIARKMGMTKRGVDLIIKRCIK